MAAAILAGCCAAWSASGQPDDSQQYAETTEPDGQSPASRTPPPVEQRADADWSKPECGKPRSHDEADLCQQRRMAESAEETVTLSRIQTGLGVAGAVALFVTLCLTWKSAVAARDAAIAAKEQAIIARNVERPILRAVEPMVSGFPRSLSGPNVLLAFVAGIENIGNGDAYLEYATAGIVVATMDKLEEQAISVRYNAREGNSIAAKVTLSAPVISATATVEAGEIADLLSGRRSAFYVGAICYRDIHGVRRRAGYCFRHFYLSGGDDPVPDLVWPVPLPSLWYDREETAQERASYEAWRRANPDPF